MPNAHGLRLLLHTLHHFFDIEAIAVLQTYTRHAPFRVENRYILTVSVLTMGHAATVTLTDPRRILPSALRRVSEEGRRRPEGHQGSTDGRWIRGQQGSVPRPLQKGVYARAVDPGASHSIHRHPRPGVPVRQGRRLAFFLSSTTACDGMPYLDFFLDIGRRERHSVLFDKMRASLAEMSRHRRVSVIKLADASASSDSDGDDCQESTAVQQISRGRVAGTDVRALAGATGATDR